MTPSLVSHYRLLEPLGEGGMGVVYRAEDLRLGREVAVKLLRTDAVGSADWLARFEREARLASSLQHPHICTIHELGDHEGQPFIAMERLEGVTVRQLIERGPMPPNRILTFARQIAEALEAAHRRGIIHRDIKPANLFVVDGERIKILDFGLAKTASADEDASTTTSVHRVPSAATAGASRADLTRTGAAIGTAAYMSPEQVLGQSLDARTDLFSLGSVLYEMATGQRAFAGEDVGLILAKIVNGVVVPARSVNPGIPDPLDAAISKLMAINPDDRYQTATDLLQDLTAALRQVTEDGMAASSTQGAAAVMRRPRVPRLAFAAGLLLAAIAVAVALTWRPSRAAPLTERDSIVIGTVENSTGDPVFDEALVTAIKVHLGQSPFLDIVSDQRIQETLRMMGRTPEDRLTHALARDACQRLAVKAMLDGSIAPLGRNYVLSLNATDCQSGNTIARAQGEATSKEGVLTALGTMTKRMRNTLGESLPSIQRFDVPIEQATTPSLAALKAYALGLEERRRGHELESIAFFDQAIEHDRQFASAYATLSTVYGSLGEWRRSEQYARLAYDLRTRVSERERLFIVYQFHDRVTGNEDRAAETLEMWKTAYPRDLRPANALALIHNRMGRYARAETEAQEALRRSPGHPFPLSNLAFAYRSMGQYSEAKKVAEEAVALRVETAPTRRLLYQLGILAGDGSAAVHLEWARNRPREFDLISAQGEVAAFEGRMREGAELFRRAADVATARALKGTTIGYVARLAWTQAVYGDPKTGAEDVRRALAGAPDGDGTATVPRFRAAAALALGGLVPDAQALVERAEQRYPEATFVRAVLSPVTRAAISLRQGRPEAAIEALRPAEPVEFGTVAGLVPTYLRAEALAQSGQPARAIEQYAAILQHRGIDPFAPVVPLAHLGIARARARAGDIAGSRAAYEELFRIWQHADSSFGPLAEARTEYARLEPARSPAAATRTPATRR